MNLKKAYNRDKKRLKRSKFIVENKGIFLLEEQKVKRVMDADTYYRLAEQFLASANAAKMAGNNKLASEYMEKHAKAMEDARICAEKEKKNA